jgi:activator of HSP90 ATPase
MANIKTKTIRQTVTIPAPPHEVYEALMDSRKHSKFTGDKARISRKPGGKFTAGSGYIDGTNLELVADRQIVQSWHASDWPDGHYSQATFNFEKTKTGTKLTFIQTGVPEQFYAEIKQGWIDYYWTPLKALFKE